MALGLVLDLEDDGLAAGELFGAGLLGIEMVEARLAPQDLAIFGDSQSL